jgi:adenine-specific DNA methylase
MSAIEAFLEKMPKVFDPFAGGGAIPLEAARLGCRSFGNDINPVAHIIQKGSLEFPQKYGKPITYSKSEFLKLYGPDEWNEISSDNLIFKDGEPVAVNIANRLSFDVEFYARKLLLETEKEIGHLYPADEKGNKPVAYYWARVGTCSNPSCRAEVPLMKQFYLADTSTKQIYLKPIIRGKKISFEIKKGVCNDEGWMARGNMQCPICGNSTDVRTLKEQFRSGKTTERLLAVIWESDDGKVYTIPRKIDLETTSRKIRIEDRPTETMPVKYTQALPSCTWGLSRWGDMFSDRQISIMQTIIGKFSKAKNELSFEKQYLEALLSYLGIFIDRIAVANTTFGVWHVGGEKLERIMGRQAIPMVFDYPESNPFCTSSGSAYNQLEWITRYIESENRVPFSTVLENASSGEKTQFPEKYITAVVTDPPYYDAIAYADLSDFFYVWLKRTLGDVFPFNFATPQTPKREECTALKHHHDGNLETAKKHFESKLLQIFSAIEHQTSDLVCIMFAHQSTEAWTTLCNSILGARMNITGSWATDTEMTGALKTDKSFLSSSVTVACRPAQRIGCGNNKEVKRAIEQTVEREVAVLYQLGFRGADLLTACFGQAVSEFGKYEKVEKADGSEVTVADLLEMARESAFNALLKGFEGDDFTKFYIGWLQLYSFAESDFDDAAKFSRVGLSINVSELFAEHILIKNGNKQTLGTFEQRIHADKNLGQRANNFLIDMVHRAMALYKGNNRKALLNYIAQVAAQPEDSFWRVVTSLCEVLPIGSEDHKQALGLLTNRDGLMRESKKVQTAVPQQGTLEL